MLVGLNSNSLAPMAGLSPASDAKETNSSGWNPVTSKRKPRRDDADLPSPQGEFSHPVYTKLSHINGDINKLKLHELRKRIYQHRLHPRGDAYILKKRLKTYYKNHFLLQQGLKNVPKCDYDYILVIDFEATCEDGQQDFPHEIIEFPVVVISVADKKVMDKYHSYVQPVFRPLLTSFCKKLTGISQDQVNRAPHFPVVLADMWKWVCERNYHQNMVVLTDGPWDMARFMYLQCRRSDIDFPKWAKQWVNIRKIFANFYDTKERLNLVGMLNAIGETFKGRPHAGIDDSINIACIANRLLEDGAKLEVNEVLDQSKREIINMEHAARIRRQSCLEAKPIRASVAEPNADKLCNLQNDMDHLNLESI